MTPRQRAVVLPDQYVVGSECVSAGVDLGAPRDGGDDLLDGGSDDDTRFGDAGLDTLFGQSGNDQLTGGSDAHLLSGGSGSDLSTDDDSDDTLSGIEDDFGTGGGGV